LSRTAKPRSSLAPVSLPRIGGDEASIDIRLKIKGKAAADLADYRQAYIAGHDQEVDLETLVAHMLAAFIDADRGFKVWRKQREISASAD